MSSLAHLIRQRSISFATENRSSFAYASTQAFHSALPRIWNAGGFRFQSSGDEPAFFGVAFFFAMRVSAVGSIESLVSIAIVTATKYVTGHDQGKDGGNVPGYWHPRKKPRIVKELVLTLVVTACIIMVWTRENAK